MQDARMAYFDKVLTLYIYDTDDTLGHTGEKTLTGNYLRASAWEKMPNTAICKTQKLKNSIKLF